MLDNAYNAGQCWIMHTIQDNTYNAYNAGPDGDVATFKRACDEDYKNVFCFISGLDTF